MSVRQSSCCLLDFYVLLPLESKLRICHEELQSHTKRKMTLLEAPTGTLLFYYNDIKQEIVHTLLLEEYGVSKK